MMKVAIPLQIVYLPNFVEETIASTTLVKTIQVVIDVWGKDVEVAIVLKFAGQLTYNFVSLTNKFHYLKYLGMETNALVDMYAETVDVSNHVADQETVNLQIQNAHKVFVA